MYHNKKDKTARKFDRKFRQKVYEGFQSPEGQSKLNGLAQVATSLAATYSMLPALSEQYVKKAQIYTSLMNSPDSEIDFTNRAVVDATLTVFNPSYTPELVRHAPDGYHDKAAMAGRSMKDFGTRAVARTTPVLSSKYTELDVIEGATALYKSFTDDEKLDLNKLGDNTKRIDKIVDHTLRGVVSYHAAHGSTNIVGYEGRNQSRVSKDIGKVVREEGHKSFWNDVKPDRRTMSWAWFLGSAGLGGYKAVADGVKAVLPVVGAGSGAYLKLKGIGFGAGLGIDGAGEVAGRIAKGRSKPTDSREDQQKAQQRYENVKTGTRALSNLGYTGAIAALASGPVPAWALVTTALAKMGTAAGVQATDKESGAHEIYKAGDAITEVLFPGLILTNMADNAGLYQDISDLINNGDSDAPMVQSPVAEEQLAPVAEEPLAPVAEEPPAPVAEEPTSLIKAYKSFDFKTLFLFNKSHNSDNGYDIVLDPDAFNDDVVANAAGSPFTNLSEMTSNGQPINNLGIVLFGQNPDSGVYEPISQVGYLANGEGVPQNVQQWPDHFNVNNIFVQQHQDLAVNGQQTILPGGFDLDVKYPVGENGKPLMDHFIFRPVTFNPNGSWSDVDMKPELIDKAVTSIMNNNGIDDIELNTTVVDGKVFVKYPIADGSQGNLPQQNGFHLFHFRPSNEGLPQATIDTRYGDIPTPKNGEVDGLRSTGWIPHGTKFGSTLPDEFRLEASTLACGIDIYDGHDPSNTNVRDIVATDKQGIFRIFNESRPTILEKYGLSEFLYKGLDTIHSFVEKNPLADWLWSNTGFGAIYENVLSNVDRSEDHLGVSGAEFSGLGDDPHERFGNVGGAPNAALEEAVICEAPSHVKTTTTNGGGGEPPGQSTPPVTPFVPQAIPIITEFDPAVDFVE